MSPLGPDDDLPNRLIRRRLRVILAMTALFVGWQANYFLSGHGLDHQGERFKVSAWLVWALVLVFLLATGGRYRHRADVRAILEDESTREHRRSAFNAGFWGALAASVAVYLATMMFTVSGREATHLIMSAAVGVALLTFAWLESRALRGQ